MDDVSTFRSFHSAIAGIASSLEALCSLCPDTDFESALRPSLTLLRFHLDEADRHAGLDANG